MKKWAIRITFTTFFIAYAVSLASEIASSVSGIVVAGFILIFLVMVSVLTDGIGVAVTACDVEPLEKLVLKNVKGAKSALYLVQKAEMVNNICSDVIGDICSIISGACGAAVVVEIMQYINNQKIGVIIAITVSSLLAAFTVGGKAFVKYIAINKSLDYVLYSAKIISKFYNLEKRYEKRMKK